MLAIKYNSSFVREFGFSAVLVAVVAAWFDPQSISPDGELCLEGWGQLCFARQCRKSWGIIRRLPFRCYKVRCWSGFCGVLWHYGSFHIISHRPFLHAGTVDGILVSNWTVELQVAGRTEFFGVWSSESLKQIGFS